MFFWSWACVYIRGILKFGVGFGLVLEAPALQYRANNWLVQFAGSMIDLKPKHINLKTFTYIFFTKTYHFRIHFGEHNGSLWVWGWGSCSIAHWWSESGCNVKLPLLNRVTFCQGVTCKRSFSILAFLAAHVLKAAIPLFPRPYKYSTLLDMLNTSSPSSCCGTSYQLVCHYRLHKPMGE